MRLFFERVSTISVGAIILSLFGLATDLFMFTVYVIVHDFPDHPNMMGGYFILKTCGLMFVIGAFFATVSMILSGLFKELGWI